MFGFITFGFSGRLDKMLHCCQPPKQCTQDTVFIYKARDEKGGIIRDKDGKPVMRKVGTKKRGANRFVSLRPCP